MHSLFVSICLKANIKRTISGYNKNFNFSDDFHQKKDNLNLKYINEIVENKK